MSDFTLNAVLRSKDLQGKGASRRLRRANLVPAIVYGGKGDSVAISLKNNELVKALESEAFFASLINLNVDGNGEEVIIKALQRHPSKGYALHVDFQRVVRGQTMNFTVPVHYVGEAVGVKEGGVLTTNVTELEITCLPRQLPEAIEVDVVGLNVGDLLRLSDIKLADGISITELASEEATDRVVVSVQPPVVAEESEDEEAQSPEEQAAEGAEPTTEVINAPDIN